MGKMIAIHWLDKPENHDYASARSFLTLLFKKSDAAKIVRKLEDAKMAEFKAKDIFRASKLSLLGVSNTHVEKDKRKIESGKALSPLLLVRDSKNASVIIADGYHRLCAVYSFDEDAIVRCKIV